METLAITMTGTGNERRETYDEGPRDTQTSYAADYSAMGPDVHDKKKKWKGRVGGIFKGFKRRLFRRGRPAETFVSDDVVMGQHRRDTRHPRAP